LKRRMVQKRICVNKCSKRKGQGGLPVWKGGKFGFTKRGREIGRA